MHAAFWSNYERGEGGFQMIHYYLFFLLLAFLFRDEKDWRRIFGFSLCRGGSHDRLWAACEFRSVEFHRSVHGTARCRRDGSINLIDGRFEGSLGNPAYVAPYLMFSMFFAAYLWITAWREKRATKWMAWGYGVLIAVFLFFFFLSQTRGAFLGTMLGALVFLLYLLIHGNAARAEMVGRHSRHSHRSWRRSVSRFGTPHSSKICRRDACCS